MASASVLERLALVAERALRCIRQVPRSVLTRRDSCTEHCVKSRFPVALSWHPSVSSGRERGLRLMSAGPGSGLSEEPALGCEPVALESEP